MDPVPDLHETMKGRYPRCASILIVPLLLASALSGCTMFGGHSSHLLVEAMDNETHGTLPEDFVTLDEQQTYAEMPRLAEALDEAWRTGSSGYRLDERHPTGEWIEVWWIGERWDEQHEREFRWPIDAALEWKEKHFVLVIAVE